MSRLSIDGSRVRGICRTLSPGYALKEAEFVAGAVLCEQVAAKLVEVQCCVSLLQQSSRQAALVLGLAF